MFFAVAFMLVAGKAVFTHGTAGQTLAGALLFALDSVLEVAREIRMGWIALALFLSLALVKLSVDAASKA